MLRPLTLYAFLVIALLATAQTPKPAADPARDSAIRIVEQIKRADYEGDRAALKRLHAELTPPSEKALASRVFYWRGFALWRRTINGFNETPTPQDLQDDLNNAIADFNDSLAQDPSFVESKIGAASCYSNLVYLNRKDPARMQEMIQHSGPLLKDAMATDPDNPRLLWVLGPIRWNSPPERGGGQDKAFELYERGLDAIRKKPAATDPLEPSWGEPELLMARAWSNLNRTTPDLKAARQDAEAALQMVPYWHYVRDILLKQIQEAQKKAAGETS
jgi:tetratricopeptide (TPR) repeat protein